MVTLLDSIELYDRPPRPERFAELIATSMLKNGQTAMVISLDTNDARCVYIVGPSGTGWTFGAFLNRVDV